jgi:hypothetical protein
MDGIVGMCSKRIKSNEILEFKIEPLEYAYRLSLTCSKELNANFTKDYLANTEIKFSLAPDNYQSVKTFVCIGELFPVDRDEEISFKWQIRVEIVDQNYLARENIYVQERDKSKYLVLGQNAKYSKVYFDGKFKSYEKRAVVKIPKEVKDIKASSESYMGRFNYYGF